jgi:Bacterial Ig domain
MNKTILFSMFALFSMTACEKEIEDTIDPTVKITNPIYGKTFKKGETINIKATVQDANLDKVFLLIFEDNATSKSYLKKEFDKSGQTDFTLDESWIANTTADSTAITIAISASDVKANNGLQTTRIFIKK